jgi:predicted DNA-binding transcriptional regulator AlpA
MPLMTTKEVAELLRVSRQTIWNWQKINPDFPKPIVLSGTSPRWREADVLAFIEKQAAK